MLLKDASIKLMQQEKQIELFKASVEAEEQQKEKIARNLHDEINPLLNALRFNLTKYRIKAKKNEFDPDSVIPDEETLDKAIEGIRTVCYDLVPSFFMQYGLIPALENYAKNVGFIEGLTGEFHSNIIPEELEKLNTQEQLNIYRICLEILNNLFKHSRCSFFKLSVVNKPKELLIEITHNGKGVTNDEMENFTANSVGLGLKSLKARVILLRATINYQKNINTSTVTLNIPLKS